MHEQKIFCDATGLLTFYFQLLQPFRDPHLLLPHQMLPPLCLRQSVSPAFCIPPSRSIFTGSLNRSPATLVLRAERASLQLLLISSVLRPQAPSPRSMLSTGVTRCSAHRDRVKEAMVKWMLKVMDN